MFFWTTLTGFVEVWGFQPLSVLRRGCCRPANFRRFQTLMRDPNIICNFRAAKQWPSPRILVSGTPIPMFRFVLLATAHARSRLVGALCLTWETLTLHSFTWRSGESNPFQWRKLHPLRHCSAAVAFPPFCPANPWRGQLKKMILVSPTCILLSQAIAGRDRCRQICNRMITIVPVGGFEPPFGNLIHDKPVV